MRKGFTIYPDSQTRKMLDVIAGETDRVAGRVAIRFIKRGVRQWMRNAVPAVRKRAARA